MRIGLIIYGPLEQTSGGYLYDRQLCSAWQEAGHNVEVISLPAGAYVRTLLTNWDRAWRDRLLDLQLDVLVQDELCHPSLVWLNSSIKPHTDYPLICLVHHLRASESHPAPQRWLYRWIERRYLSSAEGFIFNSQPTKASVEKLLDRRTPGVVASPGRDHLQAAPMPLQSSSKVKGRPLQILFVGNLIRRKGLHWLLQALSGLTSVGWHLHVVGRHDLEPAYSQRLLSQLGAKEFEDRVTYHGEVRGQELPAYYQRADLLAGPSNYEGFGLVYLEAMGHGLPVLASAAGGATDLVQDGKNGFLITPGNVAELRGRLSYYLHNPEALLEHGQAARARYQQQPRWSDSAAIVLDYFERTLQNNGF